MVSVVIENVICEQWHSLIRPESRCSYIGSYFTQKYADTTSRQCKEKFMLPKVARKYFFPKGENSSRRDSDVSFLCALVLAFAWMWLFYFWLLILHVLVICHNLILDNDIKHTFGTWVPMLNLAVLSFSNPFVRNLLWIHHYSIKKLLLEIKTLSWVQSDLNAVVLANQKPKLWYMYQG